MRNLTVAITGITGLAGSNVAQALNRAGHRVIGLSRRPISVFDGFEVRSVQDLRDSASLRNALNGCEAVFHFADRATRNDYSEEDVDKAAVVMSSLRIAASDLNIRRIVTASSVYAENLKSGKNRYGRSKYKMEVCATGPGPGASAVVLRLPPLYGGGKNGSLGKLSSLIDKGWPIPLASAKAPRRFLSFQALGELCAAISALDNDDFTKMEGMVLYPSSAAVASLAALAAELGNKRTRLVPAPGIDWLLPGVISPLRLLEEQQLVYSLTGWRDL